MSYKQDFLNELEEMGKVNFIHVPAMKFKTVLRDELIKKGFSKEIAEKLAFYVKTQVDYSFDDELINKSAAIYATIINNIDSALIANKFELNVVDFLEANLDEFNIKYIGG